VDNDIFATPPPGTGALSEWGRIIGALASLDASVKALEKTLQRIEMVMDTNFRAVNEQDTQQANDIQNLTVREHKVSSDLETLYVEVDKQAQAGALLRSDLVTATDARKALAARLDSVLEIVSLLTNRVRKIEDALEQYESPIILLKWQERLEKAWPYIQAMMWAAPILGAVLLLAVAGAIFWAMQQSRAGIP